MRRAPILIAVALLAACNKQPTAPPEAKGGPPPLPAYQMRAEAPAGDRLSPGRDGKALFEQHCGYCHLAAGMGTNLLVKQRLAAGAPPESALLSARTDLTPDYVRQVVRQGKNAMPQQTKVDITDAELDSVALYLGKAK